LPPPGMLIGRPAANAANPVDCADGSSAVAPTWIAPVESDASLPPPTWAAPVSPDAVFPLPSPTCAGAETVCVPVEGLLTDAAAPSDAPLDCTTPVEPSAWFAPDGTFTGAAASTEVPPTVACAAGDALSPPAWTAPVEPDAVFDPGPPAVTGAVTAAVGTEPTETDGAAPTLPTWTAPVEFVAVLSARAVPAPASARAAAAPAVASSLRYMRCLLRVRLGRGPSPGDRVER